MGIRKTIGVLALGAASTVGAQQPARTIQQDFEAATALDAKPDKQAALAAWTALEVRTASNKRSHAIVLVRKSAVLLALDRKDDAVAAARAGLADLPASDATLAEDRYQAYFNLGRVAQNAIDYASAADAYGKSEPLAGSPSQKLSTLLGLIETQTFVDPVAAAGSVARADAVLAGTKASPTVIAQIAMAKTVLLLNTADLAGARTQSALAVKSLGGLTTRVDLRDVSARSNAAIVNMLGGKSDEARRYMAYTGAGRIPDGSFDPAIQMKVPDCGGEAGLKPADMAVVQFSIGDDGTVVASEPVYAAGGGAVALEFARATRDWSWTPEQVKALPTFFRYNVRVELRCSTAFERPSINSVLRDDLGAWLAAKGAGNVDPPSGSAIAAAAAQRAALANADAKGDSTALRVVPMLYGLATSPVVDREESNVFARRALAIADANGAPATARLPIDLAVRTTGSTETWRDQTYRRLVLPILSQPIYANDPQARAALRLLIADSSGRRVSGAGRALLDQVASDPALPANDPMRVGALVRIASLEQAAGNALAARAAFEKSGLAANQCAIVDAPPHMISSGGTFPQEAQMWGFEGWTRVQYDVAADGKVVNIRALMSYPPFVFSKAGTETVATSRFTKSYRPDGGLGCGASTGNVRFVLPQNHG